MNAESKGPWDIVALGCVAVDDVVYVPTYPGADGKVKVSRRTRQFGGLTGAALVAAARLGARCLYAGRVGFDEMSGEVKRNFAKEGIAMALEPEIEAGMIHSTIVVSEDTGSRAIFYELCGEIGAHPTLPPEETLRRTAVLFIDHYGMAGNLRAARLAREAGAAVVADFEGHADPLFAETLEWVDHLVLSAEMACAISGRGEPAAAARALWNSRRAAVVVTDGVRGCWSVTHSSLEPRLHPAFPVMAKDTTGCGDVFHGAYAAMLARGVDLEARIRFASAAAALKAAEGIIPHQASVERFLTERA